MKIQLTEQQKAQVLGEVRFIGAKVNHPFEDGKRDESIIESVTFNLAAPMYGEAITLRVDTNEAPNIKPYGLVNITDLVYDPYAGVSTFGGQSRGKLMDRFTASSVLPASPSERLADENGEKTDPKMTETKPEQKK
ncbi:hypothetical protein HBP99_13825 [Listeria booriae]|uniref:hypothetical protein n=1 Tax=Listeria booriae TaxID=1552123 RepID=UPI0016289E72|nr:hypothetical protein [Listeria booriae]MBC2369721.1 hypothetical protein [Listeria booriae]